MLVVDDENAAPVEDNASEDFDFEAAWRAVKPDDLLTLIYTSGTTGPPKGVQLTHANLVAGISGFDQVIDFPDEGRVVSWLPMAHIAERACSHYLPMFVGFFDHLLPRPAPGGGLPARGEAELVLRGAAHLGEAEGGHRGEHRGRAGAGQEAGDQVGARRRAEEGPRRAGRRGGDEELAEEHAKADELVLSKIRERLGLDAVESVNVGAAPTPREVIEFFHAIGIPLAELWGMSETTGYGTCNPPERIKIGTVGPPSPGAEIKLADDGEVLIRGPFIMTGYRNQPEKTRETIDEEGWLHTGDIGELDDDGYLKLVDRKKELIINAGGKNMSPANIEAKLKASSPRDRPGDRDRGRKALQRRADHARPGRGAGVRAAARPGRAEGEVGPRGAGRERADGPRGADQEVQAADEEWQPGGDELTPTMKLKRKPIHDKYRHEIEELYGTSERVNGDVRTFPCSRAHSPTHATSRLGARLDCVPR